MRVRPREHRKKASSLGRGPAGQFTSALSLAGCACQRLQAYGLCGLLGVPVGGKPGLWNWKCMFAPVLVSRSPGRAPGVVGCRRQHRGGGGMLDWRPEGRGGPT